MRAGLGGDGDGARLGGVLGSSSLRSGMRVRHIDAVNGATNERDACYTSMVDRCFAPTCSSSAAHLYKLHANGDHEARTFRDLRSNSADSDCGLDAHDVKGALTE